MAKAESLLIAAGGLAFAGSLKEAKAFPPNGYAIVGGTIALVILASTTHGSAIESPVVALAGLTLLVSVYTYVPAFTKGKNNG